MFMGLQCSMVNYWTHATLVAMMKGDDVDEQKGTLKKLSKVRSIGAYCIQKKDVGNVMVKILNHYSPLIWTHYFSPGFHTAWGATGFDQTPSRNAN